MLKYLRRLKREWDEAGRERKQREEITRDLMRQLASIRTADEMLRWLYCYNLYGTPALRTYVGETAKQVRGTDGKFHRISVPRPHIHVVAPISPNIAAKIEEVLANDAR